MAKITYQQGEAASSSNANIILSIVFFAVIMRISIFPIFSHIPNVSPIDAIALFSGAMMLRRFSALLMTFISVAIGDLFLNKIFTGQWHIFYNGFYWQYLAYAFICLLGFSYLNSFKIHRIITASIASSLLFFTISNFGVWFGGMLYPHTIAGLTACYVAAIPFFKNTLISDLFFSIVLFAVYSVALKLHALPASSKSAHVAATCTHDKL